MSQEHIGILKQSTAFPFKIYASLAGVPVTGKVDGDWTKKISKNGGALGAMTVTITEDGFGWYDLTLSSSHTDTLGLLTLNFTATGVDGIALQFRVSARIYDDLAFPNTSGRGIDVNATGEADANVQRWVDSVVNALIAGRVDANAQVVGDKTGYALTGGEHTLLVDEFWDEDIQAAHGTADTGGFLLRVLGRAISTRTNNANLNALLGVADTAGKNISNTIWDAVTANYNTAGTMGAVMNSLVAGGFPTVASIADGVWDEDIQAAHGTADTAGLLLRVLGRAISVRANNATLAALLGVADVAAATVPTTSAPLVWDVDIQAAHGTVDTAGLLLRVLGRNISTRANNPNLNALLGVADSPSFDIAYTICDEIIDPLHLTAGSLGQRIAAIDDLTQAAGPGDLAYVLDQAAKVDQAAADSPATADSLADRIDAVSAIVAVLDRQVLCSVNIEANSLRVETAVEQYGVVQTTPWTQATVQIFDEANALIFTIGPGDFGAIGLRGFFTFTWTPHLLISGKTYQLLISITDGMTPLTTSKVFKIITV